jgi:hypothetical protein
VKKSLQATGLQAVLMMRALVLLHTSVCASDGKALLDVLPYPVDTMPAPSPCGVAEAEAYLNKHGLKSVLLRFREVLAQQKDTAKAAH